MFVFECHTHERDCLVMFLGQYTKSSKQRFINDVQRAYKEHLTPELVLFVYPRYLKKGVSSLLKDENIRVDLTRQKSSLVICLSFDEYAILTLDETIPENESQSFNPDLGELGADIIKSGYDDLMGKREKEVLVKSPSGTTFAKPSGESLEEFIYASQLARCNFEHQFVAMSILKHAPDLNKIDTIYIDTSSISSIAESIIYYISRFKRQNCKHIDYRSFSSYSGLEENIKPDNVEGAWVIISASASLSMGKKLVRDWGIDPRQVLTILSYKKLLEEDDENIGNDVVFCLEGYSNIDKKSFSPTKVQVQGESFSAEVSAPDKIMLLKKFKPDYIDESIYKFHNTDVFSVNRGDYTLFVDYLELRKEYLCSCGELSKNSDLYIWIKKIVEWKIPRNIKAIISPRLKDAVGLVNDFKQVFADCGFDINDIREFGIDDQKSMEGIKNSSVLILSPVVSTGHVFVDVNRALRLANHEGMRVFATPFVVAPSEAQFNSVNTSLTQGIMGFKYSYLKFKKIFLTSKNISSWSKEIEVITALITDCDGDGDVSADFWVTRKELIEKEGDGLNSAIGVHRDDPKKVFELVPGFVFWPDTYKPQKVNLSAVFATIGAILQNLRENDVNGTQLSANIYQHSVLDPENFVRFNDSILQSCLWRCALPGELDYRRSESLSSDMQRILTKILKSTDSPRGATSLDLLMGLATRWIKISPTEMNKVIQSAEENLTSSHAKLLVKYLKNEFVIPPKNSRGFK